MAQTPDLAIVLTYLVPPTTLFIPFSRILALLGLQDSVWPLILRASSSYAVGVGVPTFLVRGEVYFWNSVMAVCLIASVPIAIIHNFFVASFVRSAIKYFERANLLPR